MEIHYTYDEPFEPEFREGFSTIEYFLEKHPKFKDIIPLPEAMDDRPYDLEITIMERTTPFMEKVVVKS